jgi:hypothetical protein
MQRLHSPITAPLFAAVAELRQTVNTEMERLNRQLTRTTRHLTVAAAVIMAAADALVFVMYKFN